MPNLDDIVQKAEKPATIIAGNTMLAWGLQEASKYQEALFDAKVIGNDVSVLEAATAGAILWAGVLGLKRIKDYAGGLVKDAWDSASTKLGKAAVAGTTAAVTGAGILGLLKAVPHTVGGVEEVTSYGLAGAGILAANKYAILPAAGKIKDFMDSKPIKHKVAKNVGAALLTAGLTLTDNVQNMVRDVPNTAVAVYHKTQGVGERDVTDYMMQYGFEHPAEGKVTSKFGFRKTPGLETKFYELPRGKDSKFHHGLDIGVPVGTAIKAADDGRVIETSGHGTNKTIAVDHGSGLVTIYRHNSKLHYKDGDMVKKGDVIASSGNAGTGPHLHFVVQDNGRFVNPL